MLITSFVPRLPPAIDGVGDYALHLAHQLRKDFGIETQFVVGDPRWSGATQIEGFSINQVSECSAKALLSRLPSDRSTTVLLHYVNYGYAKRGCPVWLVDGLQRWHSTSANRFLVTMFHEVYAYGQPPWTSTFWLSSLQRNLAARLAKLSDRCLTSRQDYATLLCELSRGKQSQIPVLPVFSSIGEPMQVSPLAVRKRCLVVFGTPNHRLRVYQQSFAQLEQTCQQLEIAEVLDIGLPTNLRLSSVSGVPIVALGQQSATDISSTLSNSFAGMFNYNPEYLAKSTIFAAYCAHGLVPVSVGLGLPVDGIEAGKHYWIPNIQTKGLELELQAIANQAHTWYQTHQLAVQAKTFAALIGNNR